MATVEIPILRYSGIYYPEILQDLLVWMRANVPEISDEDPHEPFIQLLRAFALVGHYNNVLLDHQAQEVYLPTARLRESVRMALALIGYRLKQPTPAVSDLVLTLNAPLSAPRAIPGKGQFTTRAALNTPAIVFETGAAGEILPTSNVLSQAWEYDASGPTWTDRTAALNVDGGSFSPWGGVPTAGDALYFGHARVEWDQITLVLATAGDCWTDDGHVWEYRDDHSEASVPDSVADIGGGDLRFNLTGFLGSHDRTGLTVRVRCNLTGASEDAVVAWTGAYNKIETGVLGQTTPSLQAGDYTITAEWREVPDVVEEETTGTTTTRAVKFTLPETLTREWCQGSVNSTSAFWLRLRIVRTAVTAPAFDRAKIHLRKQYVKILGTQGETAVDDPIGSSTGLPSQIFTTTREDVIEGTLAVEVDEGSGWVAWTEVVDFLSSSATARHYTVAYDPDGRAVVTFGNGTAGRILPMGTNNLRFLYRYGAIDDGNVGAGTITQNASGLAIVASVTNPRPAVGWRTADGGTDADLARIKVAGPAAALRTAGRAITAEDCELLVVDGFVAADGSRPIVRAKAFEEDYGPKTIGLAVVGAGGATVPSAVLPEIDTYFNGDPVTETAGTLVLNHELTSRNFVPRAIDVTATITGGDQDTAEAAIRAYLSPTATKADGTWAHRFGGTIFKARISDVIFDADSDVENVVLAAPAADVVLAKDELPIPGTITLTMA